MASEFDLIDLISEQSESPAMGTVVGIGDDAAVLELPPDHQLVSTMDTLNAGVHFFSDVDPACLGHKSLAVNLSDLAAMGAIPRWVLLSLSLPSSNEQWLRQFIGGFVSLAREHGVQLVGGDTCQGPLSITVTALGWVRNGASLLRSTARPGDLVVVSGKLGLAAQALRAIRSGLSLPAAVRKKLECPSPRVDLGRALVGKASACIDLSDGLLADLGHVASASGCGAEIELSSLPAVEALSALEPEERWELQLGGGDDYELCFTFPPKRAREIAPLARQSALPLTVIGRMVEGGGVRCVRPDGAFFMPSCTGHEHFNG